MTRKIFLTLMVAFTALNLAHNEISIYRANAVTDLYLDQLIKNSVLVGCVIPTKDYDYCRNVMLTTNWGKLVPDLKRVSEKTK